MAIELFTNLASTTVSSGGTTAPAPGTTESWTVASSASFPAAVTGTSQFHIQEDDLIKQSEIILVTNVSGTTWSVTRGVEGTTPVAHTTGFTVVQTVTNSFLSTAHTTAGVGRATSVVAQNTFGASGQTGTGTLWSPSDHAHGTPPYPFWKDPVRTASTTNVAIATALVNGLVMDGITLATGDRVLLKDQTTGSENGIYVVAASGAASRAADADTAAELFGMNVDVISGTLSAQTVWGLTNTALPTLGSTTLTFQTERVYASMPVIFLGDATTAANAPALKLQDLKSGQATPVKMIRSHGGNLEFVADDTTTVLAALSNAGVFQAVGEIQASDFLPVGLTGAVATVRWVGGTNSGAPTTGTFIQGDFVSTQNGHFWICTTGGSPSTWVDIKPASALIADDISGGTFPSATYSIGSAIAGSVGLEIGSLTTSGQTAYMDFHSAGTNTDYDTRIYANGSRALNTDTFRIDVRTPQLGTDGRGAGTDFLANDGANEGGQINLKGANNNGSGAFGDVSVDNFQGNLRFITPNGTPYVNASTGYLTSSNGSVLPWGLIAYAQITANTTVNATTTAITTGLSITGTLVAGRRYRLSAMAYPFSTVAGDVAATSLRDGATALQSGDTYIHTTSRGYHTAVSVMFTCVASGAVAGTSLNAGSHTFNVYLVRDSGTGTLNLTAGTANPNYLFLEDIGV